jgi:nucleoside-diphosphate-sugar epimerase
MNILLTGASGTVGKEALLQLLEHKYPITVFDIETKNSKAIFAPYSNRIKIIYGDVTNKDEVEKACKDIDCVIHLAAIIPPLADEKPDLAINVNTKGTENLIKGLETHSPNAFFLFSSSVSVYGDRLNKYNINVGDKLQASVGDEYAKTKIAAEKIIQSSNLKWSIFRLSAIMGIGNHKMTGLMFHMPLNTKMEITTPKDTARAFVNAITKQEELIGKTFNLGGGEQCRITYQKFIEKNFELSGLGKLTFPAYSFAEKNFHCGYYEDGDKLEEIVSFREDTIDSYFEAFKASISGPQRFITKIMSPFIKWYMTTLSEPLHAKKKGERKLIERFFN